MCLAHLHQIKAQSVLEGLEVGAGSSSPGGRAGNITNRATGRVKICPLMLTSADLTTIITAMDIDHTPDWPLGLW